MDAGEALTALATASSLCPYDLVLGRCRSCGAQALGRTNLSHRCQDVEGTAKSTSAAGQGYSSLDNLEKTPIHWAGEALQHDFLAKMVDSLPLRRLHTAAVLESSAAEFESLGWAAVVPPDWRARRLPDILVHQDANSDWILASAIGMALSHSRGHPELGREARDLQRQQGVEVFVRNLDLAKTTWTIWRCGRGKDPCAFSRPYRIKGHGCIAPDGNPIPSETGAGQRQCRLMVPRGEISWFHDLAAKIKSQAWTSFVTKKNPSGAC